MEKKVKRSVEETSFRLSYMIDWPPDYGKQGNNKSWATYLAIWYWTKQKIYIETTLSSCDESSKNK
jgi:hypothetical protein